ncbi:MAG TPA: hypothetical protein VIW24_16820 [Aldersonia sp.]
MNRDFTPLLVELATKVWRLQGKLAAEGGTARMDGAAKVLRAVSRQLDSMADALADAHVVVQSHTGDPFDDGQRVEVIARAPSDLVLRETVAETVTPTVYIDGLVKQMGQVVVATPVSASGSEPAETQADRQVEEPADARQG